MKQVLLTEHPHLYSVRHTSDTRESVSEFAQAHIAGSIQPWHFGPSTYVLTT